jgi:hypothetical protein
LIYANGIPDISPPPIVQSTKFLNEPGRPPAYSGVEKRTAWLAASCARRSLTAR